MHKVFIFIIQLLLISICGAVVEETLEERKKRIMRKYASIKTTIMQSDMEVVSAFNEDERVIASEIMQVDDLQFEREEPNRMIRPPVVHPNMQQDQSNWLLDSEEVDLEENVDVQGEYWSMFGVSNEKPERKASREYIYQPREQQSRKDIFGFRAPEEGVSVGRFFSRGSYMGAEEATRTQWGAPHKRHSFLERSVYTSPDTRGRKSQYGQNEKDQRIQSIGQTPSVESFNRPVFVKPLPESEELFSRPQADFTPRVQIQRNNPGNNNRDLERFIEQNRR